LLQSLGESFISIRSFIQFYHATTSCNSLEGGCSALAAADIAEEGEHSAEHIAAEGEYSADDSLETLELELVARCSQ
jgi:hypothetical protein